MLYGWFCSSPYRMRWLCGHARARHNRSNSLEDRMAEFLERERKTAESAAATAAVVEELRKASAELNQRNDALAHANRKAQKQIEDKSQVRE